jgi:hypothetical protein
MLYIDILFIFLAVCIYIKSQVNMSVGLERECSHSSATYTFMQQSQLHNVEKK